MIHKSCEAEMPSVLLNLTISAQSRPARWSAANTEEAETDQRSDVLQICKYLIKTQNKYPWCTQIFLYLSLSSRRSIAALGAAEWSIIPCFQNLFKTCLAKWNGQLKENCTKPPEQGWRGCQDWMLANSGQTFNLLHFVNVCFLNCLSSLADLFIKY